MAPEKEGEISFTVAGLDKPCTTWYKIFGDFSSGRTPLVILHGGPGACHEYLLPLTDLTTKYSIPTIHYDQIGNGRSTHLPEKNGDEAFWTEALFRAELDNLIDHLSLRSGGFDLYGHSWGGMLATGYAALKPKGMRKLVISNSLASMEVWRESINELRGKLPQDIQETLKKCEEKQDFESKEYEAAIEVFYRRHLCLVEPWPAPELQAALDHFAADPTTYGTLYGPSELSITGSLRDWTSIPVLHKITAETLLMNGSQDEAQDVTMRPFFRHIPKVKWITLDNASHFSHVEQRERYMAHLSDFLLH